ncbi:MAG: lactonase family protein [Candidatus Hydrogenedentes bacterium]|nr:lactonase family protein [Candidatus Hydrogenedentota bacterium]
MHRFSFSPIAPLLLAGMAALPMRVCAQDASVLAPWHVFIGTYTGGDSEGIYLLTLDPETGQLTRVGIAAKTQNPSFLALHPTKPILYAVGELPADAAHPGGTVSAFRIDEESGMLTLLNQESSKGPGPCHAAVAPSGRHVAVANYGGGSIALLPVQEDGSLGAASAFVQHEGKSANPKRQEGPHAHSVNFDRAGTFLFAADLGVDKVFIYRYDGDKGLLTANQPAFASLAPGAGPRHFTFHPAGHAAYVVNELDNTVSYFTYDAEAGRLDFVDAYTTLPDGFEGVNHTAEIRVDPLGNYLYASNRGHDSIASFLIHPDAGTLIARGHTSTGGKTPRNFNLDPEGRYLLAANQDSGNIVVFRVNPGLGTLEPTGSSVEIPSPVCVVFRKR